MLPKSYISTSQDQHSLYGLPAVVNCNVYLTKTADAEGMCKVAVWCSFSHKYIHNAVQWNITTSDWQSLGASMLHAKPIHD